MIALKAAYIEGFNTARETDGNSAFEAWLHSAAKLNVALPPSSPWLPIESAPKDGSRILAKDNYDDETVVLWSHGRNEWRLNIGGFHEDTKHDFTYWMPLHTAVALPPSSPVADSPTPIIEQICPWCDDRIGVLKPSGGCLTAEVLGWIWHPQCADEYEAAREAAR